MSRSKATKRRRVWVLSDKDGHNAFSFDPLTANARAYWTRAGRTCTLCVERLPGDVVLSREDVAGIKGNVAAMGAAGRMGMEAEAQMLSQWIDALLRGRR